jgi:hypothetical protein
MLECLDCNGSLNFGTFEDRILFESTGMDMLAVGSSTRQYSNYIRRPLQRNLQGKYFINKLNGKPDVEGITPLMRRQYLGQARALRAMYNFYLVTIFNKPSFYDDLTIPVDFNDTCHQRTS